MMRTVTITVGDICAEVEWNDTPCAGALADALPIRSRVETWGDEIYFSTPVCCPAEPAAREELAVGEVAYWPPGQALCVFFGPTPASAPGGPPRAASAVNPVGRILGDCDVFRGTAAGDSVIVEASK